MTSASHNEGGGDEAHGWILADFDDTLAPGDSHSGLLRYILRQRLWPLLLWPLIALGGLLYCLPDSLLLNRWRQKQLFPRWRLPERRQLGLSLIWWAITLGLSPLGWRKLVRAYCHTRPGLYQAARALLVSEGARCQVISASPRALVRAQLYQQMAGQLPRRITGSRMHYRWGGLIPRFYCHGPHKLLPELVTLKVALVLSDSLHDLPLLALGEQAWLINPTPARLQQARVVLPRISAQWWSL